MPSVRMIGAALAVLFAAPFVLAGGLIILFAIMAFAKHDAKTGTFLLLVGLIFAGTAIASIVLVIVRWRREPDTKFPAPQANRRIPAQNDARSGLVLDTSPALIGETLRGHVEIKGTFQPKGNVRARLSYRLIHDVDEKPTSLWSDMNDVPLTSVRRSLIASEVPVEFSIPPDLRPSGVLHLNGRTDWVLTLRAKLETGDYAADFPVPVSYARDAQQETGFRSMIAVPSSFIEPATGPVTKPPLPKVLAHETPSTLRLSFPPFQARSQAMWMLFITIFFGLFAYLGRHSCLGFLVMFPATLLLAGLTLDLFFASSSVIVRSDSVWVERRVILPIRKTVPRAAITDVRVHLAAAEGTSTRSRKWYRIDLLTHGRKWPTVLGKYIENRGEADWLVAQIRRRLGFSS